MLRQRSVSKRMLSRVRDSIVAKSRTSHSVRAADSASNLVRRLSGKRRQNTPGEKPVQPYEISRDSFDSYEEPNGHGDGLAYSRASLDEWLESSTDSLQPEGERRTRSMTPNVPSEREVVTTRPPTLRSGTPNIDATPRASIRQASTASNSSSVISQLAVPYVDLTVTKDREFIDYRHSGVFVVTIVATVRSRRADLKNCIGDTETDQLHPVEPSNQNNVIGSIMSLRICHKPMQGCTANPVDGQKAMKGLHLGQTCVLRLRVHVPPVSTTQLTVPDDARLDALFAGLESMLGILQTDALLVEVKYRHSMLANDVVMVRETCSIRRPDLASPWSLTSAASVRPALPSTPPESAPRVLVTDTEAHTLLQPPSPLRRKRSNNSIVQPSPPKTTTAVKLTSVPRSGTPTPMTDSHDTARTLWRHLRRSSQPIAFIDQRDETTAAGTFEGDENVRALKDRALANKRSIGAETLRGWQFEEKFKGEMPWL